MEQRLANVGIHCISPDWLSACNEYLREQNQPINEDEILQQVMNTDLRNVVRRFDALAGSTGASVLNSLPSVILRNAMKSSTESSNNQGTSQGSNKAALPQSFKLIVQVEELLDVSLNAEQRLALGPASSSSPTPVGNQSKRCLKLLISDGYFQNGDCRRLLNEGSSSSTRSHIVAMETEPIPNLSVHSKPGIKVALSGPIEIRFGIMMLHPGNTTVLGGCVPDLIPIQKKAMDLAAKLAGIGIDPTFRALVWNPHSGMEEDEDEGEGESADLPVRPARPANAGHTLQVQPANQPRSLSTRAAGPMTNRRPLAGNTSTTNGNSQIAAPGNSFPVHVSNPYQREPTMQRQQQQQIEQVPVQPRQQLHSGSRQQRSTAPNSSGSTPSVNPYRRQDTPSSTRIVAAGTVNTPTPSNSGSLHNPYAAGNQMTRTDTNDSSRSSTAKTPRQMSSTATAEAIVDLTSPDSLDTSSPAAMAVSNISQMSIQSKTPRQSQPKHPTLISSNPYTTQSANSTSTSSTKNYPLTTPKRNVATSSSTSFQSRLSPTALSEPMSFGELKVLMKRITADPNEYKLYEKKSFIVPCKYPAKKNTKFMGFKIEKQKDYKKKKGSEKVSSNVKCSHTHVMFQNSIKLIPFYVDYI